MNRPEGARPARRSVLLGLGAGSVGLGATAGFLTGRATTSTAATTADPAARPPAVEAHGEHQAGVSRPATPQRHAVIGVYDLPDHEPAALRRALAALGETITVLTGGEHAALPDGPGDVSITVGLGPSAVRALLDDPTAADQQDPPSDGAPGTADLPPFGTDHELTAAHTGGDLLLAAYSSDANDAGNALLAAAETVPGLELRWRQRGFRAHGSDTVARNPLGFLDGVIVPRGAEQLAEHVWIASGPAAGGTIAVIRRFRLDMDAFAGEHVDRQEQIIGRRRGDGTPLSGGGPDDQVDLLAKSPEGEFLTPAHSHVRAAHPSFTGSHLMLRRGYGYDNGDGDAGLLFMCYQRDLRTFVQTQYRLEEVDDLMAYTSATASGTFLILAGFTPDRPLGL